jgi:23S rRNA (adenine2503-C2)-methyltransferase
MDSAPCDNLPSLIGLSRDELFALLEGMPKFRVQQIWNWLYFQGVNSFDEMTNLPKDLREKLKSAYSIERPEISHHQKSIDGTQKWLLKFKDGQEIETVFIPEETRGTLCVSSQVGCTLTCKFCHTGTQLLVRNLTAAEIVAQVMVARDFLEDWPTKTEGRKLTNIVFMGMGEPLYNYDNVAKALKIIMDENGLWFSKRRITLSTSGVVPMIEQCGRELGVNLAISLHAPNDALRTQIIPLNNKYPLNELMNVCRTYPGTEKGERITFEYVMLKDVNDSPDHARELIRLIRGIPSKINLIPFNPWPGSGFERSSSARIREFSALLENAGYASPVRRPRGDDILAACGQLKSESKRIVKHKRDPFSFEA